MKKLVILIFLLGAIVAKAQKNFDFGLTLGGLYSMPQKGERFAADINNGYGQEFGIYISKRIWKPVSLNAGIACRGIKNNYLQEDNPTGGYYDPNDVVGVWLPFKQTYWFVPINLRFNILKDRLFLEPGIEVVWLTSHKIKKDHKNELNWKLEIGKEFGALQCSVNYIQGMSLQGLHLTSNDIVSPLSYKQSLFQLKIGYSIWHKQ
ncbi:MAG: hypothetical protein RBS73_06035 [Prolixibacteraceae bacterium]|jgi:hypothetical protein|nr:hypothetical protein [Prolixibacteraceae bacterium]